ncbi:DUF1090 family protein [Burkholderia cenocepacia]|uniref:DUF1090 family protein n=1 Tax=Burkholderia cenocepacia TaxID=95486 RepID=UPI002857D0FB|nr:DUF1090 family protein [Burkholderia cenocepacia]MDR8050306.1 DUF1090 domain-containing protein [Burkholderia cenocepacia]
MKKILITAVVPCLLLATPFAFADTQDCVTKARAIEAQIDAAKTSGNRYQLAGLQQALAKNAVYCTDARQIARATSKVRDGEEHVRRAQEDVRRAESQLKEKQARGDIKKIARAEDKLREKQDKLREEMNELHNEQTALERLKAKGA